MEITALTRNISYITETVTVGGVLHWFANQLVEKSFISQIAVKGILGLSGVAPAQQAGQLLDSVFAKIRGSRDKRHWFNEFVDIFSHDTAYEDLRERLTLGATNNLGEVAYNVKYALCNHKSFQYRSIKPSSSLNSQQLFM